MNKVWIIGLSRTGTMALTKTINQFTTLRIEHSPDYSRLTSSYFSSDGAADIVVARLYKELDKKYPNSKFILTTREKESWAKSVENFITTKDAMKKASGKKVNPESSNTRLSLYGSVEFNREGWLDGYDKYHADVREYFKDRPDDLLEIDFVTRESTPKEVFRFLNIQNRIAPTKFVKSNEGLVQSKKWK
jgi:hypothetical protein